jgi:hypothetical protein
MALLIIIIVIALAITPFAYFIIKQVIDNSKLHKLQYKKDYAKSGEDIPRPVRNLTAEEAEAIKKDLISVVPLPRPASRRFTTSLKVFLISFFLMLPFTLYNYLTTQTIDDWPKLVFAGIVLISTYYIFAYIKGQYYLDLRSPVFGTSGILINMNKKIDADYVFQIRNILVSKKNVNSKFFDVLSKLDSGALVYMEYSPHSGRIWKLIPESTM